MAIDVRTKTQEVVASIENPAFLQQIEDSLPENVSLQRFVSVAKTAVRTNPKLVEADQNTLFAAIVKCAQDGLFPDGREAALVIYGGKVQYLAMIGGYRKIAGEYGWSIETSVVYGGDEFDFQQGLDVSLVHRRARPGAERGDLVNAYAIARHRDGRKLFVVLDEEEVEKCRQVSRAKDDGPWVQWTERMWEKTAGKRLFKELPLDPNDARIDRILREGILADPIAALYGRNEAAASPPSPAAGGADAVRSQEADAADNGGSAAPTLPSASAPGADEPEEGVWEPVDEPQALSDEVVEAAAQTKVPGGVHKDKTFAEVAGEDGGPGWFLTQLKKVAAESPARPAIETFVEGRLPEQWQAYLEWKAAQS